MLEKDVKKITQMAPASSASDPSIHSIRPQKDSNPWLVENVKAFSFLNCPECAFKVKEENLFQDHAMKHHSLSSVLFGSSSKTECVYIKSEPNDDIMEDPVIKNESTEDTIEPEMTESEPIEDIIEHQMIENEHNEGIRGHPIIATEPSTDIIEHHMIKTEHNEDITEHNNHIIDPLDSEAGIKNETVEEIYYPDFDKEASTSTGSVMANWVL